MARYRPVNADVEAVELTLKTLGDVLRKIQEQHDDDIKFEINGLQDWQTITVYFKKDGDGVLISNGDFVVFHGDEYEILSKWIFKQQYQEVDSKIYSMTYY